MRFADTYKCNLCGHESGQSVIASTNVNGSPDLDRRPPEMERSTIDTWIQICPSCHYCAADISKGNKELLQIVQSDSYQTQLNDNRFPELANHFLCYSLIQENIGKYANAGWACIHAAWVCDDANNKDCAEKCRNKAVFLFEKARQHKQEFAEKKEQEEIILVDLLRRTGKFKVAIDICNSILEGNTEETISNIMVFQKACSRRGDTGCHTIEEAIDYAEKYSDSLLAEGKINSQSNEYEKDHSERESCSDMKNIRIKINQHEMYLGRKRYECDNFISARDTRKIGFMSRKLYPIQSGERGYYSWHCDVECFDGKFCLTPSTAPTLYHTEIYGTSAGVVFQNNDICRISFWLLGISRSEGAVFAKQFVDICKERFGSAMCLERPNSMVWFWFGNNVLLSMEILPDSNALVSGSNISFCLMKGIPPYLQKAREEALKG